MPESDTGKLLRELRQRRGWTLKEAAARMGMSEKGYQKIEYGERGLSFDRLKEVARAFDVPLAELARLGGGEAPPASDWFTRFAGRLADEEIERARTILSAAFPHAIDP